MYYVLFVHILAVPLFMLALQLVRAHLRQALSFRAFQVAVM